MITDIHFCSRLDAERRLMTANPDKVAVVSITDPGQAPVAVSWPGKMFRLSFLDVVPAKGIACNALGEIAALGLISYLEQLNSLRDKLELLIHCEFGASRSAAVALYAEAFTGADLHRKYLAFGGNQHVLDVLQRVHPLAEVVTLPAGPAARQ